MDTITPEQVLKASPEEYEQLKKIVYRRAMARIGTFVAIKVAIHLFIYWSAKKYWRNDA